MQIDPGLLKVLADPIRSFAVYSLVPKAKTARMLADELGVPVTRLYYHLQQLERHGLVFVERTRLVSGILEKHYRAAAREMLLDRDALAGMGRGDPASTEALLGFVFDQSRVEIARGLREGRIDPRKRAPEVDGLVAWRNVLKLSPAQAARLYAKLHAFWMEYDAIAHAPAEDGRMYAFAVALYPNDVPAEEPAAPASDKRTRTRTAAPHARPSPTASPPPAPRRRSRRRASED